MEQQSIEDNSYNWMSMRFSSTTVEHILYSRTYNIDYSRVVHVFMCMHACMQKKKSIRNVRTLYLR